MLRNLIGQGFLKLSAAHTGDVHGYVILLVYKQTSCVNILKHGLNQNNISKLTSHLIENTASPPYILIDVC
jgi:hypothetical protein